MNFIKKVFTNTANNIQGFLMIALSCIFVIKGIVGVWEVITTTSPTTFFWILGISILVGIYNSITN